LKSINAHVVFFAVLTASTDVTLRRWFPMGSSGNEFVYDLDKAKKVQIS